MDDLELLVNGMNYSGWTSLGVTRAIDAATTAFTSTLTEKWEAGDSSPAQVEPWPILPGDACEVRLAGFPMVIGYVDIFKPSFSDTDHSINIQGRDKVADLVDCSAVHTPDEWKNINLLAFAKILAAPFGVSVDRGAYEQPLSCFRADKGGKPKDARVSVTDYILTISEQFSA